MSPTSTLSGWLVLIFGWVGVTSFRLSPTIIRRPRSTIATEKSMEISSSVIISGITADTSAWKCLCPGVLDKARGPDVVWQWSKDILDSQATEQVARQVACNMLAKLSPSPLPSEMVTTLAASLQSFMDFCRNHLESDQITGYRARIVATRGEKASTKCPTWHQDHVPVRWIQSLYGPGVQWVTDAASMPEGVCAGAVKTDDEDSHADIIHESVEDINARRVNSTVPIRQPLPGQGVMLVGKTWSEFCRPSAGNSEALPAVVHKSPSGLMPWEGRVLLTMDVVTNECGHFT